MENKPLKLLDLDAGHPVSIDVFFIQCPKSARNRRVCIQFTNGLVRSCKLDVITHIL